MEITRIRALRGPNLWSPRTSIEAVVSCAPDEVDIASSPQLMTRIRAIYPQLRVLPSPPDGIPPSLAHVLAVTVLSLQTDAGCPVSLSRTSPTPEPGVFQIVVEYTEESVGRRAMDVAERIVRKAFRDEGPSLEVEAEIRALTELYEDDRLGPSTGAIVHAALARNIPYKRLTLGSLVQLGWGKRARRIQAAEIDSTSVIAESIAQDKELTKQLLAAAGCPVPESRLVFDEDAAWKAALELGLPVVVKPLDGNHGRGVTVNIVSREHLAVAFRAAREESTKILVERYLPGHDFRMLVVGNKLIAAARREPPMVVGDGVHTVRELVDEVNRDPRRGEGHATSLTKIKIDEIAVARLEIQGFTPDSVPPRGHRLVLRNNANLSTGGTATDVTDELHPALAERVVAAAQAVGLDVCGVDVVCESVHRPLEEQSGGVVEVNAAPGLRMHISPSYGRGRDVGSAIIDEMFAPGDDGRIPVVAVTGTNGKTTTVRLIASIFEASGLTTGMTTTDGIFVGEDLLDTGDCSGPRSARAVLAHPDVEAAVLETARGGILREGLAFDKCDVAVVTNMGVGDHLGLNFITTIEDLAVIKRVIVQNVAPTGYAVLNADDPEVLKMMPYCTGGVILFSNDPYHPALMTHRALGRRVIYVDQNAVVAFEKEEVFRLPLREVPLTHEGKIGFQVANVMSAVAAGWGAGQSFEAIATAVRNFDSSVEAAPGRFNILSHRGATVIADYGHNPDAMQALVQAVESMPAERRRVVISGAGDRRDQDIIAQTEILGRAFDSVILYQDACQRGRADGEVLALLRKGLEGAARTTEVEEVRGEFKAIDRALSDLKEGDLCLILIDQVEEALAYLKQSLQP